jgi:DNA polymerase
MTVLWGDTETRSECSLPVAGAYNYAAHHSTKLLLFNWAFDDDEVEEWWPDCGRPFPESVKEHIRRGGQLRFHNAGFDRLIFELVVCPDFDVPTPKLEQWYCTAAQARANCAPGSLEDAGRFAGASMRKDHRGTQLIRQICIPPFNDDPALFLEFREYGKQDVRTMRAISQAQRPLSAEELADYHVNERINDTGVLVDVPLAQAAMRYAAAELEEIQALVVEVTQGAVTSVRSPRMREWVWDRVGPQARDLMMVTKKEETKRSIDKNVRASLLVLAEENPDEVPAEVADVVQCADDLWASSVAKFARMADLADEEDHRVRGAFVFAGGAATGRASSYGLQVHNFARKTAKEPDAVRTAMVRGHQIVPAHGKRVTDVLKGMLRPSLMASPGQMLVAADWSAIEARVNPWLSNSPEGDALLDVFREGRDIYCREAAAIFNLDEQHIRAEYERTGESELRQQGKVAILACGFGGAVGAFNAMGRIYNVVLPEAQSRRMVDAWRRANPWAVKQWSDLEQAYTLAMRQPGREFTAGRVTYLYDGQHLWYALPSGRVLCYPFARKDRDGISYAKAAWKPAQDAKEWPRARLWHGLACENIVQATANDLLRDALRRLDAAGERVILHIHDEVVLEAGDTDAAAARLQDIMTTPPAWASGLPLAAEVNIRERYGK